MHIEFLLDVFREQGGSPAIVCGGRVCTYSELLADIDSCRARIKDEVSAGCVVGLEGDFSPKSIALFLTLVEANCIVVPQSNVVRAGRERKDAIAQVQAYYYVDADDQVRFEKHDAEASHPLFTELRERKHPGLVLFSSGTSGDPKGAVHDFTFLLEKFQVRRKALTTLNFLLFDHWGGLNTMLHTLSNGATVVTVRDRSPEAVCRLVEQHQVNLLPATPTFLNLMLLSGAYKNFDLSSLEVITYGAEPMPQSTLDRLKQAFPKIKLQQTYGLIELGVLRSKSREDGSLWVKIGGDGYQTRVVDGILQIKAKSTILGYLNADAPITEDGWFITGDAVVVDGDYFHILGRKSELINVGGEKVYPAEVESVIQTMEGVLEVTVFAEKNPLIGNIVCAKIRTANQVDAQEFSARVKTYCRERLERFKVPVKIELVKEELFGDRFKKVRRQTDAPAKETSGNNVDI